MIDCSFVDESYYSAPFEPIILVLHEISTDTDGQVITVSWNCNYLRMDGLWMTNQYRPKFVLKSSQISACLLIFGKFIKLSWLSSGGNLSCDKWFDKPGNIWCIAVPVPTSYVLIFRFRVSCSRLLRVVALCTLREKDTMMATTYTCTTVRISCDVWIYIV